jgi:hypothetical protein
MSVGLLHKKNADHWILTSSQPRSPEEPAQQATRKIVHNTPTQGPVRKSRRLTEFVAPGECHSVGYCQDQSNNYRYFISIGVLLVTSSKIQPGTRYTHQSN